MAHVTAFDDFGDELWVVAQHIRILFQHGGANSCLDQAATRELKNEGGRVVLAWKRRELQNASVTLKLGPGATQYSSTSLGFDERHRFLFCHRFTSVRAVRPRQRRGQLVTDNFASHYSCRVHDTRVRKEGGTTQVRCCCRLPYRLTEPEAVHMPPPARIPLKTKRLPIGQPPPHPPPHEMIVVGGSPSYDHRQTD